MDSIGRLAAEAMDEIGRYFGEEADVRAVAIVVEVDDEETTHILSACSDDRSWVHCALLREGCFIVEDRIEEAKRRHD